MSRRSLNLSLAAAWLLAFGGALPAQAAEAAHAAPADRAEPAAPKSVSLDQLREHLNEAVGAVQAAQARTPTVRVHARAAPARQAKAAAAAAHVEPAPVVPPVETHERHWSYAGETGPAHWAELKPSFATCASGARQSPIDIRDGFQVDLAPIKFDYRPTGFNVIDNGHTVQVNLGFGNTIEAAGQRYELVQFHFHRPSEERIEGRAFDMVIHLVHKDQEGRLAVVAVLLQQGSAHPAVQAVWNSLPLEKNQEQISPVPLDLNQLLPADRRYYTYMGSLTTPPCTEGVLWLVMKQPVTVSPDQVALFARLYPMNARPIQYSRNRTIKESN
jgi:carbonic anhydrase